MQINDDVVLLNQQLEDRFFRALLAYGKLVRLVDGTFEPENFSSGLKNKIYLQIVWHVKEYEEVPSRDLLLYGLEQRYNADTATLAKRYLQKIEKIPVPEWNWIVKKIDEIVKSIRFHKKLFLAADQLKAGKLEVAQELILHSIRQGGILHEETKSDIALSADEIQTIVEDEHLFCAPTRIYALDAVIKGLFRKELFVIMAPLNVGKSWGCIHLAVSSLISGKHVLYLTLETAKVRVQQRIFQNISGVVKQAHEAEFERVVKVWDDNWADKEELIVPSLLDIRVVEKQVGILRKFGGNLSVREYASGSCSTADIEREIMLYDAKFGKIPDILIVDGIPDVKNSGEDDKKRQVGLGVITRELRRFATEYNMAVVATHQANRVGMQADIVGAEHTGGAIEIMQIADVAVTLNQTRSENKLGKMRLFLARARGQQKWLLFEMFMNLQLGQFCQVSRSIEVDDYEEDEVDDKKAVSKRLRKRYNRREEEEE